MTSSLVNTCRACGCEYSGIACDWSDFVRGHGESEFWLRLIEAAAGVLAARERLAETLACTDEQYAQALASLEIMLDMAIWGVGRGAPLQPDRDAWVHPGLTITLVIVEAARMARQTADAGAVWRAAANARLALERLVLPWDGLMAVARRSAAMELRLCGTCAGRAEEP